MEKENRQLIKYYLISLFVGILFIIGLYVNNEGETKETNKNDTSEVAVPELKNEGDFSSGGELAARGAVRFKAKNPDGVDFEQKIYERVSVPDSTYECKWRITGTNSFDATVAAYGYAKVKYKGIGNINNPDNWDVERVYIEDMQ